MPPIASESWAIEIAPGFVRGLRRSSPDGELRHLSWCSNHDGGDDDDAPANRSSSAV